MSDDAESTPTHRYLSQLGQRSFLRLWSYSGIYTDRGLAVRGEGAELCDLLVVFGDHVLVFSDKSCEFPDLPDLDLAWRRWYVKAIRKSASQVWGAERWLRNHPSRIFTDRRCQHRFPISLPDPANLVVHRIVVAHDPSGRRAIATGGTGSLRIDLRLQGDAHEKPRAEGGHPFATGHIDPTRGFVHVLDDVTLEVVMRVFDTAPDFLAYLTAKEALVASGRVVGAVGEEQLAAIYLTHVNEAGDRAFVLQDGQSDIVFANDHWGGLLGRPEYARKLAADRISYLWDQIIDEVAKHAVAGTSYFTNVPDLAVQEQALRLMAAEPRLRRRKLSVSLRQVILDAGPTRARIRTEYPWRAGQPHYVFMPWGPPPWVRDAITMDEFRHLRAQRLSDYCAALAARLHADSIVVGLATEGGGAEARSWEHLCVRGSDLTEEVRAEALSIAEEEGWFKDLLWASGTETDLVAASAAGAQAWTDLSRGQFARNDRCPCGSGKKYKKCHGR